MISMHRLQKSSVRLHRRIGHRKDDQTAVDASEDDGQTVVRTRQRVDLGVRLEIGDLDPVGHAKDAYGPPSRMVIHNVRVVRRKHGFRSEDSLRNARYQCQDLCAGLQIEHLQPSPGRRVQPEATVLRESPVPAGDRPDERLLPPVVQMAAVFAHQSHAVGVLRHRHDSMEALYSGKLRSRLRLNGTGVPVVKCSNRVLKFMNFTRDLKCSRPKLQQHFGWDTFGVNETTNIFLFRPIPASFRTVLFGSQCRSLLFLEYIRNNYRLAMFPAIFCLL